MDIAGREITNKLPPYCIAEVSCSHLGNLDEAMLLVAAAKRARADAVKFQCYQADRLTLECGKDDFVIKSGPWAGKYLYDLYKKCETPREWFPDLFGLAKKVGITAISSVFSPEDVDFLETLDCPCYKIASMEIVDTNLIACAAKTGKPLIISTGMASMAEVGEAIRVAGSNAITLRCVSGYPTPIEETNLPLYFSGNQGISDHTLGWEVPVAATALGAVMIEKHLTASRRNGSEDAAFSLTPPEFKRMTTAVRQIWMAMQSAKKGSEEPSKQLRRSLYAVKDIAKGEQFTMENVRSIRPSYGLPPKELNMVLEKKAFCNIEKGEALKLSMLR